MANLIITIISIGLIAVAAIMAIYYGGQAFQNGQIDSIAGTIVSESQQILAAQRMWASDHNQPETDQFISTLVTGKYLTTSATGAITQLGGTPGGVFWGELTTYNYGGYSGQMERAPFAYNNGNYVVYTFRKSTGLWNSGDTNNVIVKIAASINAKLASIPAIDTTINGVAVIASQTAVISATNGGASWFAYGTNGSGGSGFVMLDGNGNLQSNLCYYSDLNALIVCVFGPS